MEELIKQAFLKVDVLGPHVQEGHYDLVVDGEIILPQVWERMVQPDWLVTMHMWPMPEPHQWKGSQNLVDSTSGSTLPTHLKEVDHQDEQAGTAHDNGSQTGPKVIHPGLGSVIFSDSGSEWRRIGELDAPLNTDNTALPTPNTYTWRRYVCDTCQRSFSRRLDLKRHNLKRHRDKQRSHIEIPMFEPPNTMGHELGENQAID